MPAGSVGIDLGASQVHVVVLDGGSGSRPRVDAARTVAATEVDAVVDMAIDAGAIAIDAPAALSTAVHRHDPAVSRKFRVARCGEIALGEQARIWVPWVTPAEAGAVPPWMQVGFAVWAALRGAGHAPIEVYPAGGFRVLAGRLPPRKTTTAGRRARIELLAPAVDLPADIETWSHDGLDALAAALTAHQCTTGIARAIGHSAPGCDGSSIWLPADPHTA